MEKILELLEPYKEEKFADFQNKLTPSIKREVFLGVRTPVLRKLAAQVYKSDYCDEFLAELPHKYFDENQLHGFIISGMKDFDKCLAELDRFLPYVDNWATCDQTSPKIFKKHKEELVEHIIKWMGSDHTYTKRFGIGMIMEHYLNEDFDTKYLDMVTKIRSDEYYVNMETAWCMATALTKQWDAAFPYIENRTMDTWTHNKTIQKAVESLRIPAERKELLKTLKLK